MSETKKLPTINDVADQAGVALGTLYRRFRSKEDLLVAALEQEAEELAAVADTLDTASPEQLAPSTTDRYAVQLAAFREKLDRDPSAVLKAIEDRRFRSVFGSITGESLTRNPKGFPRDHAYNHLLRLKDGAIDEVVRS